MVKKLKKLLSGLTNSAFGTVLTAILYALMLILVFIFFTGNGQFIYEL